MIGYSLLDGLISFSFLVKSEKKKKMILSVTKHIASKIMVHNDIGNLTIYPQ